MALVELKHLNKDYYLGSQKVAGLVDVNIEVRQGEFLAIAGPSGSGKTTLLNIIGCIDTPTSGSVTIAGHEVSGKSPDRLASERLNHIGFIFQTFNLMPVLTAWENVEFPLLNRKDLTASERQRRVAYYLYRVGLQEFMHRRPDQMSGGQRQRVAIARALAGEPDIILADEPTANLDRDTGVAILSLMKQLNRRDGVTFILSTHDAKVIAMATRVVRMTDGAVIDNGEVPDPMLTD